MKIKYILTNHDTRLRIKYKMLILKLRKNTKNL